VTGGREHPFRVAHFADAHKQAHAARLGMWLFLGTEILLFGGLFAGYATYRTLFRDEFKLASTHLNTTLGLVNTFVLITSSLTMALAIYFAENKKKVAAVLSLLLTIGLGGAFLVIHGFEYAHEYQVGALPGKFYAYKALPYVGASLFYTLYFLMTGLHSLHVIVGIAILAVLATRTLRGDYSPAYFSPLELGGMYWHLVDLIWIFLFPLLYLI
jgi:cytochrome c oxidase subunit 3